LQHSKKKIRQHESETNQNLNPEPLKHEPANMNQKSCRNYQKPDTSKTFQKTETSKTFQKTEPYFRRCTHMHQIFATRAACQIVGDWLPASIRGHQGQQKRK
jgi:hypothetical protein